MRLSVHVHEQERRFLQVSDASGRSGAQEVQSAMGVEHLIELIGGAVGVVAGAIAVVAAAWKLFVEVDAWRRNRRRVPRSPAPPQQGSS